jgi:hypothetical protein
MAQREAEGRRIFIYASHTGTAKVEDVREKQTEAKTDEENKDRHSGCR